MSAHSFPINLDRALRNGFFRVNDPGASGTFFIGSQGMGIALVVTAAAESRALPAAGGHAVGTRLLVVFDTDGGNLTITGADTSVVLTDAGDTVEFIVSRTLSGSTVTHQWNVLSPANGGGAPLTLLSGSGAAPSTSGLLIRGGTSANPNTTAVADAKFIELWCDTTATSGDNRLAYLRYDLEGAGGGECLRAFTRVNENVGTAHGAHISLSYEAVAGGSETSGLGAAVRGTTHIPDIAAWAPTGTVYAGMLELYSDGTASDPAGLTELAVLCLSNSGDATGKAVVDTDAAVISIQGFTAAGGVTNAVTSTVLAELAAVNAVGFRVKIGSSLYYIPCVPAADWN